MSLTRRPDLHARGVGRKHRPPDMIGAHKARDATLDHRHRLPPQPDILPNQRPRALIILRNPPTLAVKHRMDRDCRRGRSADGLPPGEVVFVGALQ
jgi:hypothetical protein